MTKVIQGLRYIGLYRTGTPNDGEIAKQMANVATHATANNLLHMGDVTLNGVKGTSEKIDETIAQLVARKLMKDDFDVIVVSEVSRLTRRGVMHFMRLMNELANVGVKFVPTEVLALREPFSGMIWKAAACVEALANVTGGTA